MPKIKIRGNWKIPLAKRFWDYVDDTGEGCWPWLGKIKDNGYGQLIIGGRYKHAHRVAYELATGLAPKQNVIHSCDNPRCCNPKHLRDASQAENFADALNRGRFVGHYGPQKLTVQKVKTIRDLERAGVSRQWMAKFFGVYVSTVARVCNRESWSWID